MRKKEGDFPMTAAFSTWRKGVAIAVLLGFLPAATACFGGFNLTRKVYKFNRSATPDKWLRWLLFLGMNVLPVYWFALLVDVFFANAWEFWAGSNPVTVQLQPQSVVGPNGEVANLIPIENGARIVVTEKTGAVHSMTLLREAPGVVAAYDAEGTLVRRLIGLGTDSPRIVEVAAAR
jgi:hypothetical protein